MIEQIVRDTLAQKLDVPVYMEKPEHPPETFVLIEKTGSGGDRHVHTAVIAAQSYAQSLYKAAALNEAVKTAVLELDALDCICRTALNSDYNFTDTTTKQYRYQAVFDITHY